MGLAALRRDDPPYGLYVALFARGMRPTIPVRSSSPIDRQTRKPTVSMNVSHQMLCGSCGSCFIHNLSEPTRAALRRPFASLLKCPPRATCDHLFSVGLKQGRNRKPSVSGNFVNFA